MQRMNNMPCPLCGQNVELKPDPERPGRLIGFCSHTPGAELHRVIDVPAEYQTADEPKKPDKKK